LDIRNAGLGGHDETTKPAFEVFMSALRQNTTLLQLHLGHNDLTDVHLSKLSEALSRHPQLLILNISFNPRVIDVRPLTAVIHQHNDVLQSVKLEGRKAKEAPEETPECVRELNEALRLNRHGPDLARQTKMALRELRQQPRQNLRHPTFRPVRSSGSSSRCRNTTMEDCDDKSNTNDGGDLCEKSCVVCYATTTTSKNIILLPCRHDHCCDDCTRRLFQCPLCRCTIVATFPDTRGEL